MSESSEKKAKPQQGDDAPEVSEERVSEMIQRAMEALPKQQQPFEVRLATESKVPMISSSSDVPPEHFMEEAFRVRVSGHNFVLSHFQIKGRIVNIPSSKVLPFKNEPRGNRFGNAADVELSAKLETHDRRIKELFLADDRMHSMFYTLEGGTSTLSEKQAYGQLVGRYMNANRGAGQAQIKQMAKDRKLPMSGTLEELRVLVAGYDADREIEAMRKRGFWANAERAKEQLMSGAR